MTTRFSWDLSNNSNANFNLDSGRDGEGCTVALASASHEVSLILNKRLCKQLTQLLGDFNRLNPEVAGGEATSEVLVERQPVEQIELRSMGLSRVCDISRMLAIGASTVWRWSKEGIIPKPVSIFPKVSGWRNVDLAEALAKQGIPMTLIESPLDDRFIDIDEVVEIMSVSRSTIYRYADMGGFPAAIKFGGRTYRWRLKEVAEFVEGLGNTE